MNADAVSETILFDFQTATNSTAWQIVNDDVMGGVSTSQFQPLTNGGAVFSGVVSLENNGGFASVRSSPVRENLNGCDAFVLRVRGTVKTLAPRAFAVDSTASQTVKEAHGRGSLRSRSTAGETVPVSNREPAPK